MDTIKNKNNRSHWQTLYTIGAIASLLGVAVSLTEIGLTFLPRGDASHLVTVTDWFTLLQSNPFMGLRNLGLLNMGFNALAVPVFLALYFAHRKTAPVPALFALLATFFGSAVFFATNRALPMLELSGQYAAAATEAERAPLVAAGRVMLAVGASHTPGTFLAFFFSEIAGIVISVVMLRGNTFGKFNAYAGVLGFALLLIFEVSASFGAGMTDAVLMLAALGGFLSIAWYGLLALRLFHLGHDG